MAGDWCWEGQGEINMAVISGHSCIDLSSGTARGDIFRVKCVNSSGPPWPGADIFRVKCVQVQGIIRNYGLSNISNDNDKIISEFSDYCFGISPPEPRYSHILNIFCYLYSPVS